MEAVSRGQIKRLLINVPPGMMKSLLVSVLWPAWEWATISPSLQYMTVSHDAEIAYRDAFKMRALVTSEWYQAIFPNVGRLTRAAADGFENEHTGWREPCAFGSMTGKRADRLIIDDPHSTKKAESDAMRTEATRVWHEDVPTRINDVQRSAIIIIMQRIHVADLSALALKENYVHLMLPMEFEHETACSTPIGFKDWRVLENELLFPERFPAAEVDRDKAQMGSYAVAGQFQQRPVPRDGAMFKRAWFANRMIAADAIPPGTRFIRHWDLAATAKKTSARTAGVKLGRTPSGGYIVTNVILTQSEGAEVRGIIKTTAAIDGRDVEISLPQDPGQAGKVQAIDYVVMLDGYKAHAEPESGDKIMRAEPFSAQCEAGNVQIVLADWTEAYIDELCQFPSSKFKDQVDATSGAYGRFIRGGDQTAITLPFATGNPYNFPGV